MVIFYGLLDITSINAFVIDRTNTPYKQADKYFLKRTRSSVIHGQDERMNSISSCGQRVCG